MPRAEEGTIVTVTSEGRTTIPQEFRDELQIDGRGRVRFVETEDGEVAVRPVERPSELRGALESEGGSGRVATDVLRSERERDADDPLDADG